MFLENDIIELQKLLESKRKLTHNLRSKYSTSIALNTGDMVEMYLKNTLGKLGKWSFPCLALG